MVLVAALGLAAVPALADVPERVPFVATPEEAVERMLALAAVEPRDLVIDLGSGDGRIVIAAARRGARAVGIEIEPRLVALSRENARRAGVSDRVEFVEADVRHVDLRRASVITVYLLPSLMDQLQPRFLTELAPGTRIVSHAFTMGGWKPDRSETVRLGRAVPGLGDETRIHLWLVPADVRGVWRAPGWRLRVAQNFQEIEIEAEHAGRRLALREARLEGAELRFAADDLRFRGRVEGRRLAGTLARGAAAESVEFRRD